MQRGIIEKGKRLGVFHCQTSGIAQGVLDRQSHIRAAHLCDDRMILILDHRVNDALAVQNDIDLVIGQIEEVMRLDHLKAFIHHRRTVNRNAPAHVPVGVC